jgi:hypothetical protein
MSSSARVRISFFVPVAVALAVFAAIVLPGADLSGERFAVACAAFLVIAPGGAWVLARALGR